MIKAVLFDLDGTLLDRDRTLRHFLHGQAGRFPDLVPEGDPVSYVTRAMELDRQGHELRPRVFAGLAASVGGGPEVGEALNRDFEERFPEECFPVDGAAALIETLSSAGCALGLITNGWERIQERKIGKLPFLDGFQAVLISGLEGVSKPDPEIFRRALERLQVHPREAVFVGDNPEADIAGARGAGMWSVWVEAAHCPRPEHADGVITRLLDLIPLVESLGARVEAEGVEGRVGGGGLAPPVADDRDEHG